MLLNFSLPLFLAGLFVLLKAKCEAFGWNIAAENVKVIILPEIYFERKPNYH
jgi:uncharacterized protein YegP (UPF0339 family)